MAIDFKILVAILLSTALVNNYVLRQSLGICPFFGVSKDLKSSVGMSIAVIFVMILATCATWPIQKYLLDPNNLEFMQTVVFILVIATLVQFVEISLKRFLPAIYSSLGVFLPLITTNCAILGLTISNINSSIADSGFTFISALVSALGAGLGFMLAMVLFTGIRRQTETSNPPEAFKGMPLTLVSAAILSVAFFAFEGVAENMFK